jgi:hypothetical protein
MKVTDALDQIAAIHEQLAKGEIYRGYRPAPVALAGVIGLVAAVVQTWVIPADDTVSFLRYWMIVASLSGMMGVSETVLNYLVRDDEFSRRRTHQVVGQFLPCLVAGAAVTTALFRAGPVLILYLPGLWAVLFSLGTFASRPYLPHSIGWVGLFYLAAGFGLLCLAPEDPAIAGWGVGGTFGLGQLATALVLYRNQERSAHG